MNLNLSTQLRNYQNPVLTNKNSNKILHLTGNASRYDNNHTISKVTNPKALYAPTPPSAKNVVVTPQTPAQPSIKTSNTGGNPISSKTSARGWEEPAFGEGWRDGVKAALKIKNMGKPLADFPNVETWFQNFWVTGLTYQEAERMNIHETYGYSVAAYYGRSVPSLRMSGVLYDTVHNEWLVQFKALYDKYIRGSQAIRYKLHVYFHISNQIIKVHINNFVVEEKMNNDNSVFFTMQMLVEKYLIAKPAMSGQSVDATLAKGRAHSEPVKEPTPTSGVYYTQAAVPSAVKFENFRKHHKNIRSGDKKLTPPLVLKLETPKDIARLTDIVQRNVSEEDKIAVTAATDESRKDLLKEEADNKKKIAELKQQAVERRAKFIEKHKAWLEAGQPDGTHSATRELAQASASNRKTKTELRAVESRQEEVVDKLAYVTPTDDTKEGKLADARARLQLSTQRRLDIVRKSQANIEKDPAGIDPQLIDATKKEISALHKLAEKAGFSLSKSTTKYEKSNDFKTQASSAEGQADFKKYLNSKEVFKDPKNPVETKELLQDDPTEGGASAPNEKAPTAGVF